MDIQSAPPRHNPTADFALGEVCYRAILSGDCPLSHTYLHEPIEPDEEVQLAWFREHLKIDKPTGDETLSAACIRLSVNLQHVSPGAVPRGHIAVYFGHTNPLAIVRTEAEAIAELEDIVSAATWRSVNVRVKQASK